MPKRPKRPSIPVQPLNTPCTCGVFTCGVIARPIRKFAGAVFR